jgi:DNA (cytosine-5)-methyltransferase 1
MAAYYNEFDPQAAQWLRNLITAGHIADGEVDSRSILDVKPVELAGFTQCHFFAGIGVWSHALRSVGWCDDRPVWTGSCPCQPFSVAGVGSGMDDERHLWPYWHYLIEQCRPPVVFGEQVEAAIRHGWLDLVQSDMEGSGYAFAAAGIPAAGVGAPHIRQRLWFVADATDIRRDQGRPSIAEKECDGVARNSAARRLGNNNKGLEGLGGGHQAESGRYGAVRPVAEAGEFGGLDDLLGVGRGARRHDNAEHDGQQLDAAIDAGRTGPTNGHWRDADWLYCRDGKWRPVEPGTFPLANGSAARVVRLRAYGNAIVSQVAQEVIAAYMECRP